ncbi:MAG TPA: chitobiase/beta-hexosaminidase C-terminal domain-containing protein, partial [Opitutaceae bacterium]|nr:chitobiase/beta-hexosaminidase C-terminal domain-containing protein [Opitutaceae bacterium]
GAPSFSPAGGTYTTTQTVTISTTTGGASIRYTTDGSTPSETAGTLYSSPVSVSSSETLTAIAYESGFTDSSVTSASYTINTGGGGTTVSFEAESLTNTPSGATSSVQTDTNSSGGKWVELAGNSVGDSISYAIPSVTAGTYQVQMEWKGNNSRGILQLSIDGTNLGPTLDQYASGQTYPTTTFGTVTFSATGTHTLKLTVTGKNSASSNYQLSSDKFTFVAQ